MSLVSDYHVADLTQIACLYPIHPGTDQWNPIHPGTDGVLS